MQCSDLYKVSFQLITGQTSSVPSLSFSAEGIMDNCMSCVNTFQTFHHINTATDHTPKVMDTTARNKHVQECAFCNWV